VQRRGGILFSIEVRMSQVRIWLDRQLRKLQFLVCWRVAGCGKKSFRRAEFPQRLEAAVEGAAFTARVEVMPFPKAA
jgi:hypothetical protein